MKRDLGIIKLSAADWKRIEDVARKSETTVEKWLRNAILADVAADESHFEEMAQREAAAKEVDRESIRRLLNGNGHRSEPSKETVDILVNQMAIARTAGVAGLQLMARAARSLKIAADIAFEEKA